MQVPIKFKVKAVKIGNSTRMTIPKEVTEHLHIDPGNTLHVWVDNGHMIVEKKE